MTKDAASKARRALEELRRKRVVKYEDLTKLARLIGLSVEPGKGSHQTYFSEEEKFRELFPITIPNGRGDVGVGLGKAILKSLATYVARMENFGGDYGEEE